MLAFLHFTALWVPFGSLDALQNPRKRSGPTPVAMKKRRRTRSRSTGPGGRKACLTGFALLYGAHRSPQDAHISPPPPPPVSASHESAPAPAVGPGNFFERVAKELALLVFAEMPH